MTKDLTPKDLTKENAEGLTATLTPAPGHHELDVLFPPTPDESRLLISCARGDYSASLIARAIEDCNAQVLNLNVTALPAAASEVMVAVRVNHRNTEAIVRSLARYGYEVVDIAGSDPDADSLRKRAAELLHLLEL